MTALRAAMQSQRTLSFSSMQVSLKGRWERKKSLVAFTCCCFVELLSVGWRVRQSVGSRLRENCPIQKEQSGNCRFSHAFDTWTLWLDADLVTQTRQQQVLLFFFFIFWGDVLRKLSLSLHKLHSEKHCRHHATLGSELCSQFNFPKQSCIFPLLTRPKTQH